MIKIEEIKELLPEAMEIYNSSAKAEIKKLH